jgi:hypothetical protein
MSRDREARGFAAAVLAVPVAIFVVTSVMQILGKGWPQGPVITTLAISMFAILWALVVILLLGLPIHILSVRRGWNSLPYYVVVGLLLGGLPFVASALIDGVDVQRDSAWVLLGACCGVAGSVAFWLVAVRPVRVTHD